MSCVVGQWYKTLDTEDSIAFDRALDDLSRVELYRRVCKSHGTPFGLTTLKDHVLRNCVCYREGYNGGTS